MEKIIDLFSKVRVYSEKNRPFLHKPILLIFALGLCYNQKERMISFISIDKALKHLFLKLYPFGLNASNTHYPFGKLENDRLWEVEKSAELKRTSVGHLSRVELLEKNIHGGFTEEIYQELIADKNLIMTIANQILKNYFPPEQHEALRTAVGLPEQAVPVPDESAVQDFSGTYRNEWNVKTVSKKEEFVGVQRNDFIAYVNSLHNLGAGGANALAESQALNHYFAELYEPFPLVDIVVQALTGDQDQVVVLTGHAGDGKSTVALDILKRLRRLPPDQPLLHAVNELETMQWQDNHHCKTVSIVKDMSELTAETRLQWIQQAFSHNQPGSWLIVSNTGPLLNTLADFCSPVPGDTESQILQQLDQSYTGGDLSQHTLSQFPKNLVIFNLARLDNVVLGAKLITRLVNHSGWQQCAGCVAESSCPLLLNRQALKIAGAIVETRVRWVYQRLTAYEQRLTLRQMVAHLALSLTGGMSCDQAKQLVALSGLEGIDNSIDNLEQVIFSEGFFGYRKGQPWREAENLRAVQLIRRLVFGGPVAVNFERQLSVNAGIGWAKLPEPLSGLSQCWQSLANEAVGVRWRFAQRRMIYLFGEVIPQTESSAAIFLDSFLQSPRLRHFDQWQRDGGFLMFSTIEQRKFCRTCLRVLLEIFSGFNAGQFQSYHDQLYLTLRRPDQAVVQPTQLVIAILRFNQFDLHYDPVRRLPLLRFDEGKVALELTLPLLDFIQRRDVGELGSDLARIHLAQLEWFRAELLRVHQIKQQDSTKIELLRAGINGQVRFYRYFLDEKNQRLERE